MSLPATKLPVWIRAKGRGAGTSFPSGKAYVQGVFDSRPEEPGQAYCHEREVQLLRLSLARSAAALTTLARNTNVSGKTMFRILPNGGGEPVVLSLDQILDEADAALGAVFRDHPDAPDFLHPYSGEVRG